MPVNLTPDHLRCSLGGCPSLHRLKDGSLLIVGQDVITNPRLLGMTIPPPEGLNVGDGERAVVISPDLLADYVAQEVRAERERCAAILDELAALMTPFGASACVEGAAAIRKGETNGD